MRPTRSGMWAETAGRGESAKAGKAFFNGDTNFNIAEYMHFCNRLLKKEPKERGKAPAMLVFCSFQQLQLVIHYGQKYGFRHYIPLVFIKPYSAQVLKANMRVVGATEYGLLLYRDKLPKFNNGGQMVFNWFLWEKDGKYIPKIHPNQKPVRLLRQLIQLFTDPGDVVIDPCAGGALLPVKPNGTVYVIHRRRVMSATVMFVGVGADGLTSFSVLRGRLGTTAWASMQFTENDIGQTVFLTPEAAEAALNGGEGL